MCCTICYENPRALDSNRSICNILTNEHKVQLRCLDVAMLSYVDRSPFKHLQLALGKESSRLPSVVDTIY